MHCAFHYKHYGIVLSLLLLSLGSPYAAEDAPPPPTEDALITVLSGDADYMTHLAAFRGLRQLGTEKSIPALSAYLHDPKKSHLARYALEHMPYPAAGKALRDALSGASIETLPGIISSLGVRRDGEAVPLLKPLMSHENAQVARFATAALGRIASPEAATLLSEAHVAATDSKIKLGVAEALLAAAQRLVADGDKKSAVSIYRSLRKKGNPEFIRVGAFAGLAKATPGKTPDRIIKAIQGADPLYRNLAREVVADTKGKKATARYVEALPTLPNDVQIEMLAGLARRGDKSARNGVVAAVESSNPAVKQAALEALGTLGNAKDVRLLAALMLVPEENIATAARNSLIRLRGDRVDPAIVAAMKKADPAMRAKLLTILDVRISKEAVPQARLYLSDASEAVRVAALNVFLQQGQASEFDAVLSILKKAPGETETALASRTLAAIARHNATECLPMVLAALKDGSDPVKLSLVDALGDMGGAEALAAAKALLADDSPAVKKKSLTVMSEWPTQDAADTLLELARAEDRATHDAGLKGYTRLAQTHPDHGAKNAMMATAMKTARSKEDKWMVLSAYGTVHSGPSLDALEAQLDDPEVQKEAAMALLKVNEAVIKHGEKAHPRVRKSLELLKTKVQTEYVVKRANELLAKLK
ncbi:MAG: HEAT repeat domain-containing protein [Candidatus Hydrogenedentes bacterium]|nr:HEAT repeat domain-containing protein [Candidatus Hydrogenedentota bacterium]